MVNLAVSKSAQRGGPRRLKFFNPNFISERLGGSQAVMLRPTLDAGLAPAGVRPLEVKKLRI